MGVEMKSKSFESHLELIKFMNKSQIARTEIVQITDSQGIYTIFWVEGE
jgi:hypothetical protein